MAIVGQIQMVNAWHATACIIGAYAVGCFGSGYYLVRAQTGRDIREIGSGSIGARNVGRVLGRSGFCATLLADLAKGALAVWGVKHLTGVPAYAGAALLAVTVGHIWPVQLGFRGGKGVATSLGGLLVLDWRSALIYTAAFVILSLLFRRTVLPGLLAYVVLPFAVWRFLRDVDAVALMSLLVAVIWFAHRENLLAEMPELAGRRRAESHPDKMKS